MLVYNLCCLPLSTGIPAWPATSIFHGHFTHPFSRLRLVRVAARSFKMELLDSSLDFPALQLGVRPLPHQESGLTSGVAVHELYNHEELSSLLRKPKKCARQREAEDEAEFDFGGYISSDEAWYHRDSLNSWSVEVRHSVSHVARHNGTGTETVKAVLKTLSGASPNFVLQLAAITMVTCDSESGTVIIGIKNICRGDDLEDFIEDIFVNFKSNWTKVRFLGFLHSQGVKLPEATGRCCVGFLPSLMAV